MKFGWQFDVWEKKERGWTLCIYPPDSAVSFYYHFKGGLEEAEKIIEDLFAPWAEMWYNSYNKGEAEWERHEKKP